MIHVYVLLLLLIINTQAWSDTGGSPVILTDIPVTHSLVTMVTGDADSVSVLMKSGASPHDYALRPSEAASLQTADLLIWTSSQLTPWLARVLENSRTPIEHIQLMRSPNTITLNYRQSIKFAGSHDHEHAHDNHDATSSHSEPNSIDPHGWLDPVNAIYWVGVISEHLSTMDPGNAQRYERNAKVAQDRIKTLITELDEQLSQVRELPFVVFHDSYHYFEDRFRLFAKGAIALGDAELPGIRRMNELRNQLRSFNGACLFSEPQFNNRVAISLARDLNISTGILDPLGAALEQGPDLYFQLLQNLTQELSRCLSSLPEG